MQLNIHHSPDSLLQRFRYFFAEIPTRNHNRSSWQDRSQLPQTDWMVSIIFVKFISSHQLFGEKQELKNSIGLVLDETEMQSLLPFLRTELFEPYRDREDMHDEVGYLDESWKMFTGISDSHVPMIRLPMNVIHDLAHRWPTELLYEQIVRVIRARNDRRFRKIAL